jgi:nucleotide-binding universal stress UspA family protein
VYKHLLIATDGSDLAKKGVEQGLDLAKALNAKATIVTVTEPWIISAPDEVVANFPVEEYERAAAANAGRILKDVRDTAAHSGIACETVHVKDKFPAEGIVDTAKARGCDLIVMASHGRRGIQRVLLGSQTAQVLALSTTPVLVCR